MYFVRRIIPFQTARHLESFATNSPFASNVRPTEKLVLEPRNKFVPVACHSASAVSMAVSNCSVEAVGEAEGTSSVASEDETSRNTDASTETDEHACKDIATPDLESFAGVHETASMLGDIYHKQFGDYLFHYVENWERTVSHRINGLLIHYRELQENAEHYQKKMVILHKKDKAKSAQHRLAEKLGRNEIKEMGAIEARDTVGEHLYLYIDEVIERAWRDAFPLLLRACRFEADFSAAEAKVLSSLIAVADTIQAIGEDEDCSVMGRLDDLQKKHPEEVYTFENPFLKLTPRKTKGKHPEDVSSKDSGSVSEEVSEDVESKAQKVAV